MTVRRLNGIGYCARISSVGDWALRFALALARQYDVRLHYHDHLGDHENVGFRLCEGDEDPELRRCLIVRQDYDILVLAYEHHGCPFGRQPNEIFAESMPCPMLLVGPERRGQIYYNSAASLWRHGLRLKEGEWLPVPETTWEHRVP